jgi:hypothetical protein
MRRHAVQSVAGDDVFHHRDINAAVNIRAADAAVLEESPPFPRSARQPKGKGGQDVKTVCEQLQ